MKLHYKDYLKLSDGDVVKESSPPVFGKHLGQEEKYSYDVLNKEGILTSKVIVTEHTSIKKPFNTTIHIVQTDIENRVLVDKVIRI